MNTQDTLLAYGEWLDSNGLLVSADSDARSLDDLAAAFIADWKTRPDAAPLAGRAPLTFSVYAFDGSAQIVEGGGYHIDGDSHLHIRAADGNTAAFNRNHWASVTAEPA